MDPSLLAAESRSQSLTAQLPAMALAGALAVEAAVAPKTEAADGAAAATPSASEAASAATADNEPKQEEAKQQEHAPQEAKSDDAVAAVSTQQPVTQQSADHAAASLSDALSDVHLEPAVSPVVEATPAAAVPAIAVTSPGGATMPVAQPVSLAAPIAPASSSSSVPSAAAASVASASSDAAAPSAVAAPASTTTPPPANSADHPATAPATAAAPPAKAGWNWWWSKKTAATVAAAATPATAGAAGAAAAIATVDPKAAAIPVASAVPAAAAAATKSVTVAPPPSNLSPADQAALAAEKEAALKAAEAAKDHLGGVESPWLHSVVRYSINKLLGFAEVEDGMEPQYHTVLCRETLWVPADISLHDQAGHKDGSTLLSTDADAEKDPPLLLEMSHFYPKGCHNTPLPVILVRTPYDRALMRHTAERICQHGYHCVIQDTRNSPNAALLKAKQQLLKKANKAAAAVDAATTAAATASAAAAASAAHAAPLQELDELQKAYSNPSSPQAPEDAAAATASDTLTVPGASTAVASSSPASSPSSAASSVSASPSPAASPSPRSAAAAASSPSHIAGQVGPAAIPSLRPAPQEFFPIVHESKDGLATIDWISKQSWCDGNISFYGASYLGIAQYAVVDHKHPALKCIVPVVSASRVYPILYPEGSLNLDLAARWLYIMFHPSVTGPVAEMMGGGAAGEAMAASGGSAAATASSEPLDAKLPSFWRRSYARVVGQRNVIPSALQHLPASDLDVLVTEKRLAFFQEMIANGHDESLPFWTEKQVKLCDLHNAPPMLIIEGWYDLFLQQALRDYREALAIHKAFQARVDGGEISAAELEAMRPSVQTFKPYLTIMNCAHIDWKQLYRISLTESIKWFDFHCKPNSTKGCERMIDRPAEKSVRVQMINASGSNEARHLAAIARRKKAEKALLAKLTTLMGAEAAAAATASAQSSASAAAAPSLSHNAQLFHELTSPRSKARQRLNALDAEWRYFPEFPPPAAQPLKYYLHCEMGIAGDERRVLRLDAPGEREREYALAVARMHEAEEKRMVSQALKNAATSAAAEVANAASSVAAAAASTIAAAASSSSAASSSQSKLASARSSLPSISTASASSSIPLPHPSAPPARSHFSCYTYDPRDPTPSIGGCTFDVENSGGMDQRGMEGRPDVLVFTSEPLEQPLVVLGFVRCTLYVRSNCTTTDFVARLCDVYPLDDWSSSADIRAGSGKSQVLCDGLFKVSPAKIEALTVEKPTPKIGPLVRSSSQGVCVTPLRLDGSAAAAAAGVEGSSPAPVAARALAPSSPLPLSSSPALVPIGTPKTPASLLAGPFFPITAPDESATPLLKLDIDMWATGNVFQVGHRIRFHVCSAAHPRWLRSLGGADPIFCGLDQSKLQHQTIYHDKRYPSALVLPVLPE